MVLAEFQNTDSPHQQLLNLIEPHCSIDGGLNNSNKETLDFVINAMQTCDKHDLRIMFTKIIIHTDMKIMDVFLDSGGWKIISDWLQDARDTKMYLVVKALVELCLKIPMNVRRLKQSDCAKLMRKLKKCPDEVIAKNARVVVEKWTAVLDQAQSKSNDKKSSTSSSSLGAGKSTASKSGSSNKSLKVSGSISNETKKSSKKVPEESQRKRKRPDSDSLSVDATSDLKIKIKKVRKVSPALVGGVYNEKKANDKNKETTATKPVTGNVQGSAGTPTSPVQVKGLFRAVTTKVKQTKSRMDFLAENDTKGPSTSSSSVSTTAAPGTTATTTIGNKTKQPSDPKTSDGITVKIKPLIKPLSLPKIPKTSNSGGVNEPLNNILPPSRLASAPILIPPKPPVIKGPSFMDAISKAPIIRRKTIVRKDVNVVSDSVSDTHAGAELSKNKESKCEQIKGNNKISIASDSKQTNIVTSSEESSDNSGNQAAGTMTGTASSTAPPQQSVAETKPVFNFYTDILKEAKEKKEKEKALENERKQSDSKMTVDKDNGKFNDVEMKDLSVGGPSNDNDKEPFMITKKESPDHGDDAIGSGVSSVAGGDALKSILLFGKSRRTGRVRFANDDKLCSVRFFELDPDERINVTNNFAQSRDFKHEGMVMSEARKVNIYKPWNLVEVDLEGFTNFQHMIGRDSVEKNIQAERYMHTLEVFYIADRIPDSASEPDFEPIDRAVETKIIPDEDPPASHCFKILPLPGRQFPTYPSSLPPPPYLPPVPNYQPESINNPPPFIPHPEVPNYQPGPPQPPPQQPPNGQVMYNRAPNPFGMNDYPPVPPPPPQGPQAANHRPPNEYAPFRNPASPPREPYNGPPPPNYWPDENFNGNQPPPPPPPKSSGPMRGYDNFNYGPRPPRFPNPRANHGGGPFHGGGQHWQQDTICRFYSRFGNCKFREKCNYKHAEPERRY